MSYATLLALHEKEQRLGRAKLRIPLHRRGEAIYLLRGNRSGSVVMVGTPLLRGILKMALLHLGAKFAIYSNFLRSLNFEYLKI